MENRVIVRVETEREKERERERKGKGQRDSKRGIERERKKH